MLGFSVYLGEPLNKDYILKMIGKGYRYIFTSLQIPEENEETKLTYLGELCQLLQNTSVTYIIDIHPSLLNQQLYSFLQQYPNGDFVIRIDDHLNMALIHELYTHNLKCCLNASTITSDILNSIYTQEHLPEILYCHNYYPRPDTGLSLSSVQERNQLITQYDEDAQIIAFIPGTTLRGPLFKGLPTIEHHRYTPTLLAAHSLLTIGIQHIMIGDLAISDDKANALAQMILHRHFVITVSSYSSAYAELIFRTHTSRIDTPEHLIRSKDSRTINHLTIEPDHHHDYVRKKGTITIDNLLNKRYEGELQMIKSELPSHPNMNHVATVSSKDLYILDLIQPGDTFDLISEKENCLWNT
ncbi:MupG family TIM beta-alpha barrel fold protein [Staphylococcus sp. NRL 16/872]|uniref:MupG family TIM beta-alpha barrel fold protein n=1 Tax=Staphylococcus sp. NRL 16/872 TaxID=2930131 RepID=UPI001FB38EB7|nr:MupG family TIM beta-alpha barrel fold protein [Staphylococcus sp. NRL 16/872]WEN69964.1 MupG family TIM beta-alpha barrel fold protein [Staphylococcus sp. NRL 16/872]